MTVAVDICPAQVQPDTLVVHDCRGGVEILDGLADEWWELCSKSADDQPFYRPEFIRAHISNILPRAEVRVITTRLDGRLQMVLPMVEELSTFGKIPVRRLRAPVNEHCGRFDAVRRAGPAGDAAICATWDYLRDFGGWDLLHFRDTPEGGAISQLVYAARADGFTTFQLPETWNPFGPIPSDPELLQKLPLNARLRTKLRQARRQLAERGSLKFYRIATADRIAIDRLFALEARGWKGKNNSAVNNRPRVRSFFDELAESAARFGYLSLYMLEFEGQLIAAHFSLHYKGRCHSPIVAYNEDFRQYAPGHLIVSEILQDCAARGLHTYDVTGLDQEWKLKWVPHKLPVRQRFIFKGPVGQVAYAMGVKVWPALTRRLPRTKKSILAARASLHSET